MKAKRKTKASYQKAENSKKVFGSFMGPGRQKSDFIVKLERWYWKERVGTADCNDLSFYF